MIRLDQPQNFPDTVVAVFSSASDGTMLDRRRGRHAEDIVENRRRFCRVNGLDYDDAVYQIITYGDEQTYDTLQFVGRDDLANPTHEVYADALFTTEPGIGLFLPVADCAATVVYDPTQRILAVLHLGRHSTLSNLLPKVIHEFRHHGSLPSDLLVWMSPHAKQSSYRLEWFAKAESLEWKVYVEKRADGYYVDLAGYNRDRFIQLGIPTENIVVSQVDTMQDTNYFSHASGDLGGRMALLAYMR